MPHIGILLRKTRRTNPLLAVRGSDFASQNKEDYMANVIDDATIDYVGILAKLELSDGNHMPPSFVSIT